MPLMVCMTACDKPYTSFVNTDDPATLFWRIGLNYGAVNLTLSGPNKSVRLTAVALNPFGDTLPEITTEWHRSDSTLSVSPDGTVTALSTTGASGTSVIVTAISNGVVRKDTIQVKVSNVADVPQLDTFTFDSKTHIEGIGASGYKGPVTRIFPLRVVSIDGSSVSGLAIRYISTDVTIATVNRITGMVTGLIPGQTDIIASTYAYGVHRVDTLHLRVSYPASVVIKTSQRPSATGERFPVSGFFPSTVTIAVGGDVTWENASALGRESDGYIIGDSIDVVFEDPSAAEQSPLVDPVGGSGNTGMIKYPNSRAPDFDWLLEARRGWDIFGNTVSRTRRFNQVGTFAYRSSLNPNWKGVIVVKAPEVNE